MRLRSLLLCGSLALFLGACGVDTSGLTAASSKAPDPKSNPGAFVTVIEYGDFQCLACKGGYEKLVQPLLAKFGSSIRFEFRQFPLTVIHQYAQAAAEASECAADQGKFWEFVDLAYIEQEKLSDDQLSIWAQTLGLDTDVFARCTASRIKKAAVKADVDEGIALGVEGTPTFFVNGQRVANTIVDLEQAITTAQGATKAF